MEGSHRTPRDEEIRIHPFSPWGVKREQGEDGRRHSKNPLYELWSCFLSRKGTRAVRVETRFQIRKKTDIFLYRFVRNVC